MIQMTSDVVNIVWGVEGLLDDRVLQKELSRKISNLPVGAISTKRQFTHKEIATVEVDMGEYILKHVLEVDPDVADGRKLGRLLSVTEK